MQIDWLTVVAQIVNFLILVWLLQRLLYKPVVNAMAARERAITDRLESAAARERDADSRAEEYGRRSAVLDEARERRLEEARAAAERERVRLLDAARAEVEQQRELWRKEIRQEYEEVRARLRQSLARTAAQAAERTLRDIADAAIERQIVNVFLRRLDDMPEEERGKLAVNDGTARLRSAFDIGEDTLDSLRAAIHRLVKRRVEVTLERDPALICGIELTLADCKVAWNIADYLADLDGHLNAAGIA